MSDPILVDVDGVLADFIGAVCRELTGETGFQRLPQDFHSYDHTAVLSPREQSIMRAAVGSPGFCFNVEPYPGAKGYLHTLRGLAKGRPVLALTAPWPSPTWVDERTEWLEHHMGFKRSEILFCPSEHKHLVRGAMLIEDHLRTAEAWKRAHPHGKAIVIARPWNGPSSHVHYARSYHDALGL